MTTAVPSCVVVGNMHHYLCSFINLKGATFIFSDEERELDWCGRNDRSCTDCRGVTGDVSIMDQCSDRIMCPNLAMKLIELLDRLQNCTENTSKFTTRVRIFVFKFSDPGIIIVHEAWDEPDSDNSQLSNNLLHGQGLEATISVSEVITTLPLIERQNYNSDDSLLETLASLALCVGFDFIKNNTDSSTLSVAVGECSNSQTR